MDSATFKRRAHHTMTNDEIPDDEGMTTSEAGLARRMHSRDALLAHFRQSSLGIRVSFVITQSTFVTYDEA